MNNTQKYVLTFAKDSEGKDIKYLFMLSLSKRLTSIEAALQKALQSTDGIDNINPHGFYTLEIGICRAFDADEVLAVLIPKIEAALSDIVVALPPRLGPVL